MTTSHLASDVAGFALRLGDDALILSQRLCEWVAAAPSIEEDLALANIALDLLGHARTLLSYSGELDGTGRSEDDFAYRRTAAEFRNSLLVELPNGDFAVTIARQLVYSTYSRLLCSGLRNSTDSVLAGIGNRAAIDLEYHTMHAAQWTVRLGRGTAESRHRMQAGLDKVWPYATELFEADDLTERLEADRTATNPARLEGPWEQEMAAVLQDAQLVVPTPAWHATGGRSGLRTQAFGPLLADFQALHQHYPGGTW
ncbi:phenylacetate-CoA oxygenase subunit PaaC [Streptomyces sp. NBC_01210]|uniref:1,2-phenylacetyl-CoA epoxidase subunit PaaC n=1 Tax=Streptomyces sp. NBC_01210 TaxID=2903774 RepID=UPI002E1109B9|nr:phenylacetate-CoA oxygenase subunit PaaC [Streptomyces sp. NBC_01210]